MAASNAGAITNMARSETALMWTEVCQSRYQESKARLFPCLLDGAIPAHSLVMAISSVGEVMMTASSAPRLLIGGAVKRRFQLQTYRARQRMCQPEGAIPVRS